MIAQTNLQLDRQLVAAGWSDEDRSAVAAANELAVHLFGGAVRSSGKPFLCHVVGTASLVVAHGGDRDLAVAGLVHAAYDQGDFGGGHGRNSRHSRRVRAVVGDRAEALVAAYHRLTVNEALLEGLERRSEQLSIHERSMLLLLLANEADDHLDGGIAVVGGEKPWRYQPDVVERFVAVGRHAGLTGIADELERGTRIRRDDLPDGVCRPGPKRTTWAAARIDHVAEIPWGRIVGALRRSIGRRIDQMVTATLRQIRRMDPR